MTEEERIKMRLDMLEVAQRMDRQQMRLERQMRWQTYRMYAVGILLLIWLGIKIYRAVYP